MLGELSKAEIEEVLKSNVIGRIGCCTNQKMLVVPITYVYDDNAVIGHTGEGMKIDILRQNPECCFEVDNMENISSWKSVIAWGTFEELNGDEARKALDCHRSCPVKQAIRVVWVRLQRNEPIHREKTLLSTVFA